MSFSTTFGRRQRTDERPWTRQRRSCQWRNGSDELHAPAFFFDLEITNILWKKVRLAEIILADADLILANFLH